MSYSTRYADGVEVGDQVLATVKGRLVSAEVTKITSHMLEGKYIQLY